MREDTRLPNALNPSRIPSKSKVVFFMRENPGKEEESECSNEKSCRCCGSNKSVERKKEERGEGKRRECHSKRIACAVLVSVMEGFEIHRRAGRDDL